jgi:hypothetical protein
MSTTTQNPWEHETDKLEWSYQGLLCIIQRHSSLKHLCGYVRVPNKNHPWANATYDDIGAEVHGGLTFGGPLTHLRGIPSEYWVGFDCAHAGDLSPGMFDILPNYRPDGCYRDIDYVKAQCEHLAQQLFEAKYR